MASVMSVAAQLGECHYQCRHRQRGETRRYALCYARLLRRAIYVTVEVMPRARYMLLLYVDSAGALCYMRRELRDIMVAPDCLAGIFVAILMLPSREACEAQDIKRCVIWRYTLREMLREDDAVVNMSHAAP